MKVHYPKLYNMANLLALNVILLPKDLTMIFIIYVGLDLRLFILVGWGRSFSSLAWPTGVQLVFHFCSGLSVDYCALRYLHRRVAY